MINGYEEAQKVDKKIQKVYEEFKDYDAATQLELLKFYRTIRTTCEILEQVALESWKNRS